MHLCAELTAAFCTLEPFGEVGAKFSLQLSSRTQFDKINKKKVFADNQCETHKKSSLMFLKLVSFGTEICLVSDKMLFKAIHHLQTRET